MIMKSLLVFVVFIISVFAACTPCKISLSNGLETAQELDVKGRQGLMINQKLSFGDFSTDKVQRSATESSDVLGGEFKKLWVKLSGSQQTFRFNMSDAAGNSAQTFCIAKTSNEDSTVGSNPNSVPNVIGEVLGLDGPSENVFAAEVYLKGASAPWNLKLDVQQSQKDSKDYVGYVAQSKENYYTIHPITLVEKNGKKSRLPIGSVGFEIKNKAGVPLAAVSLIDRGKVYIGSTDANERLLLASVCAALLLHQPIG